MLIDHFFGSEDVQDEEGLERVLTLRDGTGANDFWLSPARYPALTLTACRNEAILHYFEAEGAPGFQSRGPLPAAAEDRLFFVSQGEETFLPASAVIPIDRAIEAAKAFLREAVRPRTVEWSAL